MEFHTFEEKFHSIMEKWFSDTHSSMDEFYNKQQHAIDEGIELIFSNLRSSLNSTDSDSYPDETNNPNCDLEIQSDAESDSGVLKTEIPLIVVTDVEQRIEGHQNRHEQVPLLVSLESRNLKLNFEEIVQGQWEVKIWNQNSYLLVYVYDTGQFNPLIDKKLDNIFDIMGLIDINRCIDVGNVLLPVETAGGVLEIVRDSISTDTGRTSSLQTQFKKRRISPSRDKYFDILGERESSLPLLRSADYYMKPTLSDLAVQELVDPGYCSRVPDFTVGRLGYGCVKFLGVIDIRGLDLDHIIKFYRHEIVVYEDESAKPAVGQGLNKASFISYDLQNGEWRFLVSHFSRFGLSEDDEEDITMDVARKSLILARLLGRRIDLDSLKIESLYPGERGPNNMSVEEFLSSGIVLLDNNIQGRVKKASAKGNVLRYVCEIEASRCEVGLQELPKNSALGRLRGSDNVLEIYSGCYKEQPLVIQGAGEFSFAAGEFSFDVP